MTTDLVIQDTGYDATMAALLGFGSSGGNVDTLPKLSINSSHDVKVEVDGKLKKKRLVAGCFKVYMDEKVVYSAIDPDDIKPIKFRVYLQRYDYKEYDEAANDGKGAYVKNSIQIAKFDDEPVDDFGTVACGKLRGKAAKGDLSPAQMIIQKKVQSYRVVYGTVSFDGFDHDGNPIEVKDYPVQLRLRGNNFMPLGDKLKELEKAKILPVFVEFEMTTTEHQKGATVYFIIDWSYDRNKRLPYTPDVLTLSNQFLDHIKTYNGAILEKHKAALAKRSEAHSAATDGGLDDDFGVEPDDSGTEV